MKSSFLVCCILLTSARATPIFLVTDEEEDSKPNSTNDTLSKLSSFTGFCKDTGDCQPNLICLNSTCLCQEERKVPRSVKNVRGESVISCVAKAGAFCAVERSNSSETFNHRKYSDMLKNYGQAAFKRLSTTLTNFLSRINPRDEIEDESCVPNSKCNGYICQCSPGYYSNAKGFCSKKRIFFQTCTSDDECDDEEGLVCGNGVCGCPSHLQFDIRTMKCHKPQGARCNEKSRNECVPNSECFEGKCECQLGYRGSVNGTCGVDHGLACHESKICASDLICHSGLCQCKLPAHQYYDNAREQCIGKSSAPCGNQENFLVPLNCTENAYCSNENGIFECRCMENYAEDAEGRCSKSENADCLKDEECDAIGRLSCIDQKCACPDKLQIFDKNVRRCRGLVGSRCSSHSLLSTFRVHAIPNLCTYFAYCDEVTDVEGKCKCLPDYTLNSTSRLCFRKL